MAKYALYDINDKLFMITNNGKEASDTLYNVLKTGTLILANHLTDQQLRTLTLAQAVKPQSDRAVKD